MIDFDLKLGTERDQRARPGALQDSIPDRETKVSDLRLKRLGESPA
jgi:hypothetical protein